MIHPGEDTFVNVGKEEKPRVEMTASIESMSSDGLIMLSSSSCEGPELVGSSSNSSELEEEEEGVDGLVLMGSTRLRPAPESSKDGLGRARLYASTYRSLFNRQDCTTAILPLALHGNLKDCPFRSLCWRVLLNVLPNSSSSWLSALTVLRSNYTSLQTSLSLSHKIQDINLDPSINNPLSQAEESPWNQHFQDDELRKLVRQDVARTFPEVPFFQSEPVRESMVNILFVYARAHPRIAYRQGMHELLAPIVFVMRCDREFYSSASAGNREELKEVPEELFNAKYEEHDIFALFEALMEAVGPWYVTEKSTGGGPSYDGKPWSRPQDLRSGNKVVDSLNYIQDVLLKRHDLALYSRLEKLEIFPQIYGIRWLRLLFGREFSFPDTLVLWDAILADSCPPSLADQLVVSLLMSVRELLLKYDYPDAVQLLMKLPSNLSVLHVIGFALHLKDPLRFAKPSGSAFLHGERKMPGLGQESGRFRKISAPSILRRSAPSPKGKKTMKMTKIVDSYQIQTPPDLPDFTVVDMKTEEFERLDSMKDDEAEEDILKMALDRRKDKVESTNEMSGDGGAKKNLQRTGVGDVRSELIGAVSRLTGLLASESLQQREEVFKQLRHMTDLCNSLPISKSSGSSDGSSRVFDFTPGRVTEQSMKNTNNFEQEQPSPLNRHTSLACDVATYFDEELK